LSIEGKPPLPDFPDPAIILLLIILHEYKINISPFSDILNQMQKKKGDDYNLLPIA
jgi:hypothetical protein